MECAIRTIPDSGQLVKDIALGKTPVASGMYQVFRSDLCYFTFLVNFSITLLQWTTEMSSYCNSFRLLDYLPLIVYKNKQSPWQ